MIILGIDSSLRDVGLVVAHHTGEVVGHTTICASVKLQTVERMSFIYDEVHAFLSSLPANSLPEKVYMEGMAYMANGRIAEIGGAHYVVQLAVYRCLQSIGVTGMQITCLSSTRVRKHVLGSVPPKSAVLKKDGITTKDWIAKRMESLHLPVQGTDHENDAYITGLAGAIEEGVRLPAIPLSTIPSAPKRTRKSISTSTSTSTKTDTAKSSVSAPEPKKSSKKGSKNDAK